MAGLIDLGGAISPIINRVLDFIPDPAAKAQAAQQAAAAMLQAQLTIAQGQLAVDQAEAANANMFVAGWRPFIGWVGGVALAWTYIGQPVASWGLMLGHITTLLPTIPTGDLMQLITAMLGLGAMRTIEKVQGAGKGLS